VIDVSKYDFVDFGSAAGDFIEIAEKTTGGRGVGVDFDAVRVWGTNRRGRACMFGDVRDLRWLPKKCVRFVTVSHLLEHMRTVHDVRAVLANAARLAREFVYVGGPCFDDVVRLARKGLKFYWADWPGSHPLHLTTKQLAWALLSEGLDDFRILPTHPLKSSRHPDVLPIDAPPNSGHYDPEKHGRRDVVRFDPPVHTQFKCLVRLKDFVGAGGLFSKEEMAR
jgi:hypothetical protein